VKILMLLIHVGSTLMLCHLSNVPSSNTLRIRVSTYSFGIEHKQLSTAMALYSASAKSYFFFEDL
jgi:hypothetical protein